MCVVELASDLSAFALLGNLPADCDNNDGQCSDVSIDGDACDRGVNTGDIELALVCT